MSKESDQYLLTFCNNIAQEIYDELIEGKDEPDISEVIPLLLFQTILDKIRAMQILYESGEVRVGESSYGIVRAVFECQWSLLYIIEEDTEFRALSYYYFSRLEEAKKEVNNLNYQLSLRESLLEKRKDDIGFVEGDQTRYRKAEERKDSAMLEKISKKYEENGLSPREVMSSKIESLQALVSELPPIIEAIKSRKAWAEENVRMIEEEPQFDHLRLEISSLPSRMKKFPNWFSLKSRLGSIYALAEHLGLEGQYKGPYGSFSQETHGLNATKQIVLKGEKAVLKNKDESVKNNEAKEAFDASIYILSTIVLKFLFHYKKRDKAKELSRKMSSM